MNKVNWLRIFLINCLFCVAAISAKGIADNWLLNARRLETEAEFTYWITKTRADLRVIRAKTSILEQMVVQMAIENSRRRQAELEK